MDLDTNIRGAETALQAPDGTWACDNTDVRMSPGEQDTFKGWVAIEAISNHHPHMTFADQKKWAFMDGATGDEGGPVGVDQKLVGRTSVILHTEFEGKVNLLGFYAKSKIQEWTAGGV